MDGRVPEVPRVSPLDTSFPTPILQGSLGSGGRYGCGEKKGEVGWGGTEVGSEWCLVPGTSVLVDSWSSGVSSRYKDTVPVFRDKGRV